MTKYYFFSIILSVFVVYVITIGFGIIGTPISQRLIAEDSARLQTIRSIESNIKYFYNTNKILPTNLEETTPDNVFDKSTLIDPITGKKIVYEPGPDFSAIYKLCTEFSLDTISMNESQRSQLLERGFGSYYSNFPLYSKGYYCLEKDATKLSF